MSSRVSERIPWKRNGGHCVYPDGSFVIGIDPRYFAIDFGSRLRASSFSFGGLSGSRATLQLSHPLYVGRACPTQPESLII
jgi:hypothetical protein